jgi:DNA polymerase III subunit beta
MKFQCGQEALADALATVGRVVPGKPSLPVLNNVLLETDGSDCVRVTASNLELTVSRRLRATVKADGRTTAPARLLAEYVALLDRGKQVSLQLNSTGHKLHLACERYEANVATISADEFPSDVPIVDAAHVEIDGSVLKAAIEQVLFAVATDDTRPVLAGVLLRVEAGVLTLAAADGYRVSVRMVLLPDTTTRASWIVPAHALAEVARSLSSAPGLPVIVSGSVSNNRLHVALGDINVMARLIEGQFPDFERVVPRTPPTAIIVGRSDLLQATRAAAVFARTDSNIVRLQCTAPPDNGAPALGQVIVKSTSAELGDNVGQLEASVRGENAEIAFNGRYLRDALEALDSPQVSLQLSGGTSPGILRPVGDMESAHLQLLMPMVTAA